MFSLTVGAVAHSEHTYGTWQFTAPTNTTVTAFQYNRSWSVWGWASFQGFRGTSPVWDSDHLFELCQAAAGCHDAAWQVVNASINNNNGVLLMLESCALSGGCDASSNGWASMQSARVTLEDSAPPTFSDLTGELASGSSLKGRASLNFQVADVGTGVYKIYATVDGVSFDERVLDDNGGRCQAVFGPHDFIYAVPCRPNLSASTSLDTTALRDGTHNVRVIVEDAAGNQTTVFSGDVTTQNTPSSTDREVHRARIVLKISPRRTRNKHTIHFRGRLIGGPLHKRGVTLLAQARRKKTGWIVFRQLGVSGKGKFAFDYRFHSTIRPTTYTFRIALADANRRSTHRTVSNPVKVRVRP